MRESTTTRCLIPDLNNSDSNSNSMEMQEEMERLSTPQLISLLKSKSKFDSDEEFETLLDRVGSILTSRDAQRQQDLEPLLRRKQREVEDLQEEAKDLLVLLAAEKMESQDLRARVSQLEKQLQNKLPAAAAIQIISDSDSDSGDNCNNNHSSPCPCCADGRQKKKKKKEAQSLEEDDDEFLLTPTPSTRKRPRPSRVVTSDSEEDASTPSQLKLNKKGRLDLDDDDDEEEGANQPRIHSPLPCSFIVSQRDHNQRIEEEDAVFKDGCQDYHFDASDDDDDNVPLATLVEKRRRKRRRLPQDNSADHNHMTHSHSRRRLVKLGECTPTLTNNGTTQPSPKLSPSQNPSDSETYTRIGRRSTACQKLVFSDAGGQEAEEDAEDDCSLDGFIVDGSESERESSSEEEEMNEQVYVDLSDEEDSSSEVDLDDVLDTIRRKKDTRIWQYEADMLASFADNPELCMQAVCALYRQQTLEEQSIKGTIAVNGRGFNQPDAFKASMIAEYLLEGDSGGPLKKSVKEFEGQYPDGLEYCRKIADRYSKQLFTIYQQGEDPFFCPP